MFTDIVGYTALMGSDEDKAFDMLKRNHIIHATLIEKHNGTLIKEVGDGTLASFPLASDAVRCAINIQTEAKSQKIPLKIGIHEGEMVFAGADVLGDGVNVASRLQEISREGCITISGTVQKDIKNKADINTKFIGDKKLKNVDDPVKVYEVLSEEEVVDAKSTKDQETGKSRSRLFYYIIAGMVVVIAAIFIWYNLPKQPDIEIEKSIAVLPFRNDSPDPENEYFCNGMVESILTNLQKIGDLRVKSRTDAEQYRKPNKDLASIAKELKVAFILEGSVQKVGDNILVTAQLIEGSTGNHLWADNYDGKYTDEIFSFQRNVAKKIAASLQAVITPEEEKRIDRKSTTEIMAYDLYWRGMDMVDEYNRTRDDKYIALANELFDKALNIDPGYALAVYGKGHAHYMVAFYTNSSYDSVMIYADKAIQLDPECNGGYHLKGDCYNEIQKPDIAIEYYLKAIEFAPNNNWPHIMIGNVYCYQKNDYLKGIPYVEKAVKLDGRLPSNVLMYAGWIYLNIGYYEKATEYFKHSLDLLSSCNGNIPGYFRTLAFQGKLEESLHFIDSICEVTDCAQTCAQSRFWNNIYLHKYDQAEASLNQLKESGGLTNVGDSIYLAYLDKKLGKENEANSILANIRSSYEPKLTDNSPWWHFYGMASVHSQLENKDQALSYLTKAVDAGLQMGWHDGLEIDPTFENLHNDPEFKAIIKRAQDEKAAIRAQVREIEESGEIDL
jgi:TolB-like protein